MKLTLKHGVIPLALLASGCSGSNGGTTTTPLIACPAGCSEYSFTETYATAGTQVCYKGTTYTNSWYAGPDHCPVKDDCPSNFEDGLWIPYDPSVKHEFTYYDYPAIKASYPALKTCTAADYEQAAVVSLIDTSIANGSLTKAAPAGGFTEADRQALYREYMLPCSPDLSAFEPANVATVKRIMPQATWDSLASKTYDGDSSKTYLNAAGQLVPWPAETGFKSNAYNHFLNAVARYPFFCGEKGYFSSVDEACKRELASLFAHAAQETGETQVTQSFYWLREYGFVNGTTYFKDGCTAPFDCSNSWARYYGRGPKQLTYYYNYAGFSAAFFNGNYNFLLQWPDIVAWDGTMFFTSAIWFVMNHQPPKPSIHDVMLGRYAPNVACTGGADCYGLAFDATTRVKNNFNVTIEIVNGGPECRGKNTQQSANRSNSFMQMLDLLKAVKTGSELNPVSGCDFIAVTSPPASLPIFVNTSLNPKLSTWLDMSGSACTAQSTGGLAMISVTATGIVEACKSK